MILFDWFEAIIYRHSVIDIDKESINHLIEQFRAAKKTSSHRLAQLLLVLFNPPSQQAKLIECYCAKLFRSLRVLGTGIKTASPRGDNLARRRVAEENFQTYLYLWLDLLITSVKHWHKYKCVVKIIDFLVAYSFQTEMSDKFINLNMLNELFNYVRADFGVVALSTTSDESLLHIAAVHGDQQVGTGSSAIASDNGGGTLNNNGTRSSKY